MAREFREVKGFPEGDYITFTHPGDSVEGKLTRLFTGSTAYGDARFAEVEDDDGNLFFFVVTAGMPFREEMVGHYIRLTYLGQKRNDRTKRDFKAFRLEIDAAYFDELPSDGSTPF